MRAGWLKLGVAIRLAQDLRLMDEPDDSLPVVEQEERRRIFWSIYIIDKLVACGKTYHTTISQSMLRVHFPSDEHHFRDGLSQRTTNFEGYKRTAVGELRCGSFTIALLAISALDLCIEQTIRNRYSEENRENTIRGLHMIDSLLQDKGCTIPEITRRNKTINGALDHQALAHIVFANAVYHLCRCLNNHPCFLRQQADDALEWFSNRVTWSRKKSLQHSMKLVEFLDAAEEAGYHINAPFYTYAISVASSILIMNSSCGNGLNPELSRRGVELMQKSIDMIQRWGRSWHHALKVVSV